MPISTSSAATRIRMERSLQGSARSTAVNLHYAPPCSIFHIVCSLVWHVSFRLQPRGILGPILASQGNADLASRALLGETNNPESVSLLLVSRRRMERRHMHRLGHRRRFAGPLVTTPLLQSHGIQRRLAPGHVVHFNHHRVWSLSTTVDGITTGNVEYKRIEPTSKMPDVPNDLDLACRPPSIKSLRKLFSEGCVQRFI
mmetsp:Transcript_31003/g.68083  ORF Transcript_31003/g.68083 Transcript_31003/m.68083 type:complete len:200 (+) Transcript_31003:2912-3511(+)